MSEQVVQWAVTRFDAECVGDEALTRRQLRKAPGVADVAGKRGVVGAGILLAYFARDETGMGRAR